MSSVHHSGPILVAVPNYRGLLSYSTPKNATLRKSSANHYYASNYVFLITYKLFDLCVSFANWHFLRNNAAKKQTPKRKKMRPKSERKSGK